MSRIRIIQAVVAADAGMAVVELLARSRAQAFVRPRAMAVYLAREITGQSLPQIGHAFGLDHTTVLHHCRAVAARVQTDVATRDWAERLHEAVDAALIAAKARARHAELAQMEGREPQPLEPGALEPGDLEAPPTAP